MRNHEILFLILISTLFSINPITIEINISSNNISLMGHNNDYVQKIPFESLRLNNWIPSREVICTADENQRSPQIISDGKGGAIIIWEDFRNHETTGIDIYAQKVNATIDTQWTLNGISICTIGNDQENHQVISDGKGGAIIAWQDKRNYEISGYDIYCQRINSSGNVQWIANATAICTLNRDQYYPSLVSDGEGGAIIAWQDQRNYTTSGYDIYCQKINSSGNVQWIANGTAICTLNRDQYHTSLVSDGKGGAIIAWQDERNDPSGFSDIFVQRVNSTGDTQWIANGTAICTEYLSQVSPLLVSDQEGGAIIVWEDDRYSYISNPTWVQETDLYAQRVNSTGDIQWFPNGTAICLANNRQIWHQIISDGEGGAIIAWTDHRDEETSGSNIYIQKVNSRGIVQWTPNGKEICALNYSQYEPNLVNNGKGGAIVIWIDQRNPGHAAFYAQMVGSDGDILWNPNGISMYSTPYGLGYHQITSDGEGGAIIVWMEKDYFGTTEYDIFAKRILYNTKPKSNHPGVVKTSKKGKEMIDWILTDFEGEGQYRIWANNTSGEYYIWQDWQPWMNNTPLDVPINRKKLGIFNYTIEYFDLYNLYGTPDTVIVIITQKTIIHFSNYFLLFMIFLIFFLVIVTKKKTLKKQ